MDICSTACERHSDNNERAAKMIKVNTNIQAFTPSIIYFSYIKYEITNRSQANILINVYFISGNTRQKIWNFVACCCW